MRPWALRGNPNLRPRVERSFWECERSFLNGREFRDLQDFRHQLAHWLDTIVDHRKRHGVTALARFADESPHLLPLPRHPYDTARVTYRIRSIDGFVDWQGNRYAVPYDHVTDILPVRITQHELFIYAPEFAASLATSWHLAVRDSLSIQKDFIARIRNMLQSIASTCAKSMKEWGLVPQNSFAALVPAHPDNGRAKPDAF